MTNKEFQEMLVVFKRLVKMINEYEENIEEFEEPQDIQEPEKPFIIPPDVYDEICETIDEGNISLFGIT